MHDFKPVGCGKSSSSSNDWSSIDWPTDGLATLIPEPSTLVGDVVMITDRYLNVYIAGGEDEYVEYVSACKEYGFTQDSITLSSSYTACNSDGYSLRISYSESKAAYNIHLSARDDDSDSGESDDSSTTDDAEETEDTAGSTSSDIDPDFKETMDTYEEFIDEYVEFVNILFFAEITYPFMRENECAFSFRLFRIGTNEMLENKFQATLIRELKKRFPGIIILKNDPDYIQGVPDLLLLYGDTWGALECKKSANARKQPNQQYYIDRMDRMSFARFVYPENKEEVLYELQRAFESSR